MLLRYLLFCEASNETTDGKLNLIGITDSLFAAQFPAVHKQGHLIASFIVEPEDFDRVSKFSVEFIDMDGVRIIEFGGEVKVPARRMILNHRHLIHDIKLPKEGTYQFIIRIDGREVGNLPIEVHKVDQRPN